METIKQFFADYGYSFLMMVVVGFVTAMITEITVKKAFDWLGEKVGDRLPRALPMLRMACIQGATWLQVIVFTTILVKSMPLPANGAFWPVWIFLVYIIQFVFSCYGIKGVLALIRRKAERAEEKASQPKEQKDPFEGMERLSDNLYKDQDGAYWMLRGRKVVRV